MLPVGLLAVSLPSMEDILCNNIKVLRFINTPVPSNTYLLIAGNRCVVIDPGSKEQFSVREYIIRHRLSLDFIILTHEHFDHCWGVNYLLEFSLAKVVTTKLCAEWVLTPYSYFNQLFYNTDESYQIERVDILVEDIEFKLMWDATPMGFILSPGHTNKGMCVEIYGNLFTGDTLLYKTKPFLNKRFGASKDDLKNSIEKIYQQYPGETKIFPGHGEPFLLKETEEFYEHYFNLKENSLSYSYLNNC